MIIYLDIDGVLKPLSGFSPLPSQQSCSLVKQFCEKHNAKIIITSTYRKFYDLESLRDIFETISSFIIGVTPILNVSRGLEILPHVKENGYLQNNIIVVDDVDDRLSEIFGKNFIKTNPVTGLDKVNIQQMRSLVY